MTQVNLLPWRERVRRIQKIYFGLLLGGGIFLSLVILLGMHLYYSNKINKQEQRNTYIQSEFDKENQMLLNLENHMKEFSNIESQLKLGVKLRKENYNAVIVLKELAIIVPNSITLTKIQRDQMRLTLFGQAQTSSELTQFMKKIDDSPVFDAPGLSEISAEKENENGIFKINIQQTFIENN